MNQTDIASVSVCQPKALYILAFAEMWERFSYYGMRALLIFYLTKHWLFSDEKASVIYGAYTALVYITPVIGGYLVFTYAFMQFVFSPVLGWALGLEGWGASRLQCDSQGCSSRRTMSSP